MSIPVKLPRLAGGGRHSNGKTTQSLSARPAQSTIEALVILAAASLVLLGLFSLVGNEKSGSTTTILGRTRELVCRAIEGGNGSKDQSGADMNDDSLSDYDEPRRVPRRPAPASRRSPPTINKGGPDSRSPNSGAGPLASKPSPTPTYAITPVPTTTAKPPSMPGESHGRSPVPHPTPQPAPAPTPTQPIQGDVATPVPARPANRVSPAPLPRATENARVTGPNSLANGRTNNIGNDNLRKTVEKLAEYLAKSVADSISTEAKLNQLLDKNFLKSLEKVPGITKHEKDILLTVERAVRHRSGATRAITAAAKFTSGAIGLYNVYERDKTFREIHEYNKQHDIFNAYRLTLFGILNDLPGPFALVAPYASEYLAHATVDAYARTGNRIAWMMWELGLAPHRPRYSKNHFDGGVKRPGDSQNSSPGEGQNSSVLERSGQPSSEFAEPRGNTFGTIKVGPVLVKP